MKREEASKWPKEVNRWLEETNWRPNVVHRIRRKQVGNPTKQLGGLRKRVDRQRKWVGDWKKLAGNMNKGAAMKKRVSGEKPLKNKI